MTVSTANFATAVVTAFELEDSLQLRDTRLILILVIVAILCFIAGFALRDVIAKRVLRKPKAAKTNPRTEKAR